VKDDRRVFERAKSFVKATFPTASRAYGRVAVKVREAVAADPRPQVVFTEIYRKILGKMSRVVETGRVVRVEVRGE
jgi:hypothetical protein